VNHRKTFLLGLSLASGALAGPFAAQTGHVLRHKKITEFSAPFEGGLDHNDQMGRAVICPGDVDGDGNPDLVSGAVGDDDGGSLGIDSDTGALWVHFLNPNGTVSRNAKISMTAGRFSAFLDTRDQLGRALAPLGDFDGDGVPDIAAGACRDDDGGVNRGAVYLLFLDRDGGVKEQRKISDTHGNFLGVLEDYDEFGRAIANLGDLDGNGVIDLAVGSIGDDDGGVDMKGAVWILFLNPDGSVLREQKISDTAGNFQGILGGGDIFGFALGNLGDVDGDGVIDLGVGCPKDDDGGVRKGAVWILFLRPDGKVKGHRKISDVGGIYGLLPTVEFGSSIAGLGDLDGDGIPDMAVGAPLDDGGFDEQGAVWINLLNADGSVKDKVQINDLSGGFVGQLADGDWFGSALCVIPDLDGNGVLELAVGARFDDDGGINTGSIWMLALEGQANVPPAVDFALEPASGSAPLVVQFAERASAGAKLFDWNFGDGHTSSLPNPQHTYLEPGAYTVTLAVSGPGGSAERIVSDAVLVRHAASASVRNGSGTNALVFHSTSLPVLGGVWTAEVDASLHPGAGLVVMTGSNAPGSGTFLPAGEVLVRLPGQGGVQLFRLAARSFGVSASFVQPIPPDPALAGLTASTQAKILGGSAEYTNAIDLVLGY
jgi:hypothetical protein